MNKENSKLIEDLQIKIFLNKKSYSSFIGALFCKIEIKEDSSTPTACTDGKNIFINFDYFNNQSKDLQLTIILHELWHIAKLHSFRRENKDPEIWNIACDININNMLLDLGYYLGNGIVNTKFKNKSEEEIYSILIKNKSGNNNNNNNNNNKPKSNKNNNSNNNKNDKTDDKNNNDNGKDKSKHDMNKSSDLMYDLEKDNNHKIDQVGLLEKIKQSLQAGDTPSSIVDVLDKFTKNKVEWRVALKEFFIEAIDKNNYSWNRPNRRHQDIYLPNRIPDDNNLAHLVYFLDVSGSIDLKTINLFHSEIKYILEEIKPNKLTVVQFDTGIVDEHIFEKDDSFEKLEVIHGGGTSYRPIKKYADKHKPTGIIILTDLYCEPMQKLKYNIPVLWVCTEPSNKNIPFGKLIHINTE